MARKQVLDPSTKKHNLALSPTLNHQRLMKQMTQELSYRGGDVKKWRRKLKRKFSELIGYDTFPAGDERVKLNVRSLWKRKTEYGTIEKVAFCAEPKSDVIAFMCLPKDIKPPYVTFICLQGHSTGAHMSIAVERENNRKPIIVEGDRDFGIGCMKRGIAALCIEQRSFGERREQVQDQIGSHGCHDATMHALLLGRTLAGERVFDVDRGIDYLATRHDIDMKRIGVMGNSGGGTTSLHAAALLDRLAFAMPSCYFCTYADSIMSIYHCMDNYVPGILKYAEMWDVMGLFAPKPVVLVAGKHDPIFPVAAVRKSFRNLKKIYTAAGSQSNCTLVVGSEGHRFYADKAWSKMLKYVKG